MADSTRESDQIIGAATQSLVTQRDYGGTHRSAASIGKGSEELKSRHWKNRIKRILIAVAAIWLGTSAFGLFVNAIGVIGLMLAVVAAFVAVGVLWNFPKMKVPKRSELKLGNPKQMVAKVELWLEDQRDALPPTAAAIVEKMGTQLDALGAQLESMDEDHPSIAEVRELVGEYIPETIDNYRKIPEHLRGEEHAGGTADERLVTSLTKLSGEIDRVTRRLAEGALDDLAIKSRYLDYRYGGDDLIEGMTGQGAGMPDTGVPLPDPTPASAPTTKARS